jgi:hypothetical protein
MRAMIIASLFAALVPVSVAAQANPSERLLAVLPADIASQVLQRIDEARARALPAQAMADLALEGVAKGRSTDEILSAVEALSGDMDRALDAFQAAGRSPRAEEVEAAVAAMRMGVDGVAIRELARSQPSGRGLTVPILVMGGLASRGLPSDDALGMVVDRLAGGPGDADLLGAFGGVGQGLGSGLPPGLAGPAMGAGPGSLPGPVAGIHVPMGPPVDVAGRPRHVPGRPDAPPGPPGGAPIG